jgi:F420-non-reducing hydrogenase iron-sulfur subunit
MLVDEGDSAGRSAEVAVQPSLTVFRCANYTNPTPKASATRRPRSLPFTAQWSGHVNDIAVPCVGKLQPEHLLKAFENGADAVCVLACEDDNCCYLEGSQRLDRRAEYVRGLLEEVGLGGERLMVFHLGDSAREDAQPAVLPEQIMVRLREFKTSPLRERGE